MGVFKKEETPPFPFFDFIPAMDRLVIGIHFKGASINRSI